MSKTVSRDDFLKAVGQAAEHAAVCEMILCACYVNTLARAGREVSALQFHKLTSAQSKIQLVLHAVDGTCPDAELECIKGVAAATERVHDRRRTLAHAIAVQAEDGTLARMNMRSKQPLPHASHRLIDSMVKAAEEEREKARSLLDRLCELQAARP